MSEGVLLEMGRSVSTNVPTAFMFLCVLSLLASLSGYSRGTMVNRLLQGTPILAGNFLGLAWIFRKRCLYVAGIARIIIPVVLCMFGIGLLLTPIAGLTVGRIYPLYIIGDAAWVLWLCLSLIVFATLQDADSIPFLRIYRCYLFVVILLALHWVGSSVRSRSLQVPDLVLFASLVAGLAVSCMDSRRLSGYTVLYLVASLCVLALALLGWGRGLFLGFAFAFLVWWLMMLQAKNLKLVLPLGGLLVLAGSIALYCFGGRLTQSRLYTTVETGEVTEGASMANRLMEADSARRTLMLVPASVFTGLGHGAVYYPYGELRSRTRNLTSDGHIHNIHVGPALLFFRYGAFGAGLYFLCWVVVFKGLLLGRILLSTTVSQYCRRSRRAYVAAKIFFAGYFIFCILFVYSHFGNHYLNPFFALSLSTTVMFISRPYLLRVQGVQ